jgi:hypothetical protein
MNRCRTKRLRYTLSIFLVTTVVGACSFELQAPLDTYLGTYMTEGLMPVSPHLSPAFEPPIDRQDYLV